MIRQIASILILAIQLGVAVEAQCRKASSSEIPHEGNEYIEMRGNIAPRLTGKVLFADGNPAGEAIIEVFRYPKNVDQEYHFHIPRINKRISACKTEKTGQFDITGLENGRYFLRVGFIGRIEINPTHVVVDINRNTILSKLNRLTIYLQLAH